MSSQNSFRILELTVIPQSDLHVESPEETGLSFIENALLKARHASAVTQLPALADDSGLVIPALDGAPGLYSARFAGSNASDQENLNLLLDRMKDLTGVSRRGHYICALALVRRAADPDPIVVIGRWHGHIIDSARGEGGFGYDPIFIPDGLHQTAAELDSETKISKAIADLPSSNSDRFSVEFFTARALHPHSMVHSEVPLL